MSQRLILPVLALSLVATWYLLERDLLLNPADEGFLWYGVWRTCLGEVPLRDFQAYFPGRYLWGAAFGLLAGPGLGPLRAAGALFGALGLFFALMTLRPALRSWKAMALSGALLLLWMYPRYKVYDHVAAILTVAVVARLLERPSAGRHLTAGIWAGLALFVGRSHGLYALLAVVGSALFARSRLGAVEERWRGFQALGLGWILGLSPLLCMALFVPGFARTLLDGVAVIFRIRGGADLSLPVPWPWRVSLSGIGLWEAAQGLGMGLLFLLLPIFCLSCAACFLFRPGTVRRKAPMAAGAWVGLFYMHYAFSRADLDHLALGIPPVLMGVMAFPFTARPSFRKILGWITLVALALVTAVTVFPKTPLGIALGHRLVPLEVPGATLKVQEPTRAWFEVARSARLKWLKPGDRILVVPGWATLYPFLEKASPLWEIYLLFPESPERQREMIRRLEKEGVPWAVIGDPPLDGREERRFSRTHPLLYRYLMEHYEKVPVTGLRPGYGWYRLKGP